LRRQITKSRRSNIWLTFARTIAHAFAVKSPERGRKQNQLNHKWPLGTLHGCGSSEYIAAAHSAEAAIHYSGLINQKIGGSDGAIFHLDAAGGAFVFSHFNFVYGSSSVPMAG
jgi:hypothetical protein